MRAKLLRQLSYMEDHKARDWFYPFVGRMLGDLEPFFPDGLHQNRVSFIGPQISDPPHPEFKDYQKYFFGQVVFYSDYVEGFYLKGCVLQATFAIPEPGQRPFDKIYLQMAMKGAKDDMPPEDFEALEDFLISDRWAPHPERDFQLTKIVPWDNL